MPGVIDVAGLEIYYADAPSLISGFDVQMVRRANDFRVSCPDPLIIDCGANIGLSVIRAKQLYPQARIIAFEPDPGIDALLRTNLAVNGFDDIQIIEAAVWTADGEHEFRGDGADFGMLVEKPDGNVSSTLVKTVRLADYLSGETVDFLKVDIEGAELPVLRSCKKELKNVRQLVVEVHYQLDRPDELSEILSILYGAGFIVSVNSYGPWIDLGHPFQRNPHANVDQYMLLCAWRDDFSK